MPYVSVIIPLYNEQENIDYLVDELNSFFRKKNAYLTEIIFVNDGSTDGTLYKLKNASHRFYTYKIISFSRNFGSHAALRAGILNAKGHYITFMYADLQDPLFLISQLFNEIVNKKVDIVWAFRSTTMADRKERLFSNLYAALMRKYAITNFPKKALML